MKKMCITVGILFFLFITIILSHYSSLSHEENSSPPGKEFETLKDISFSQFKNGKKVWNLTAQTMKDKGDLIILNLVKGDGITKKGEKFTFYIDRVTLNKKTYSFSGSGNIKILYKNKKILGKKIEYNSKENRYIILHGIIYINSKFSFSGEKIYFLPDSTKVIVEGKNEK